MSIKYAVFNPAEGTYTYTQTKDECLSLVAKICTEFFLLHTHGNPFSVVEMNDDNTETWRAANGDEIFSPAQIEAQLIEAFKAQ